MIFPPKSYDGWLKKGIKNYNKGDFEKALECFKEALFYKPEDKSLFFYMGKTLNVLGRYGESISFLDMTLAIDPSDTTVWYLKGNVATKLGLNSVAKTCYEESLMRSRFKPKKPKYMPPPVTTETDYNPYSILGVRKGASWKEIEDAYRIESLKWHPDKWPSNLTEAQKKLIEEKMKDVTRAHHFLKEKYGK
jgi:tetratricopeptide (TPR) repeat protein